MPEIWAGVDIGKEHHHCVVIDADGERLLSRRVLNDETELLDLIGDVLAISADVLWAVDLNHGGAALLIGLLVSSRPARRLSHRPGRPPGLGHLPGRGQDRREGRLRHRRPGPRPPRPGPAAARRRDRRRPAHPDHPPPGPGLRPHPADQPPARPTPGDLPCAGARPGTDQPGAGDAADRLPDPGRDPPRRRQADRDVAEEPQGPQRRRARQDGRSRPPRPSTPPCPARSSPPPWWSASRRG